MEANGRTVRIASCILRPPPVFYRWEKISFGKMRRGLLGAKKAKIESKDFAFFSSYDGISTLNIDASLPENWTMSMFELIMERIVTSSQAQQHHRCIYK